MFFFFFFRERLGPEGASRSAVKLLVITLLKEHCSKIKSSQVYFTTCLKVRRPKTATRSCGHPGQLHLLAILYSYRHKLSLVMEPPKKIKNNLKK